jgi:tetratricopeptide (TPR) repeat protein
MTGQRDAALATLQKWDAKVAPTTRQNWLLAAWLHDLLGQEDRAKAAREEFAKGLKNQLVAQPLPMPSLAVEVLKKAETELGSLAALWRARVFDQLGDTGAAALEFARAIDPDSQDRNLLVERGNFYRRIHDWPRAIADYKRAIELKPDEHYLWFSTLPLMAWSGDESYATLREAMLKRFGETPDPSTAERTAKVCALGSVPPDVARSILTLTERAIPGEAMLGFRSWFRAAHALSYYRNGKYTEAIEQAQLSRDTEGTTYGYAGIMSRLIQALAQNKLGKPDEARKLLEDAEGLLARITPDIEQTHPDGNFHDLLICLSLKREAIAALRPNAPPQAPAPREALNWGN